MNVFIKVEKVYKVVEEDFLLDLTEESSKEF